MLKSFAVTLLATAAFAADGLTDYSQMGANWGDTCPTGREQSPIDLSTGADNSSVQSVVVNKKYPDLASAKVENKGATINVY
jgi:carbonic anhydrase